METAPSAISNYLISTLFYRDSETAAFSELKLTFPFAIEDDWKWFLKQKQKQQPKFLDNFNLYFYNLIERFR